eukprot:8432563-Pyramimonas_sp.AAC.1
MHNGPVAPVTIDPSKWVPLRRGTKQRDPVSSLIFSGLSEDVVSSVNDKWLAMGEGVPPGYFEPLNVTNSRYAEDVLSG